MCCVKASLLSGIAVGVLCTPAMAQEVATIAGEPVAAAAQPEEVYEEADDGEAIVITGQREVGAVIGDIEPELQLDSRDIQALGAGSISELLEYLTPQTRSGRGRDGGRPIILLNGRRISGYSEIRNLPPEAILRIDVLPEEAALNYGYRPDQRVVNFVLRPRFRAVTAEVDGGIATAGGRASYGAKVNVLGLSNAGRSSLDVQYRHSDPLFESQRDIVQTEPVVADLGDYRSLLSQTDQFTLGGTLNRTVFGDVSGTVNANFESSSSLSYLGLRPDRDEALLRESDTLTGRLGVILNGDISRWRWSATGSYDLSATESRTDRESSRDRAESRSETGSLEATASGPIADLPAGRLNLGLRGGFDTRSISSEVFRAGAEQSRDLSRQRGHVQANLNIPVASRSRAVLSVLGDLSVSVNAELEQLSDFGTLRTFGGGMNWSPIRQVQFNLSYTDEDGAPSMQQLGDPMLLTPAVRVFDFLRGETVDITRIEGGNPDLRADSRRVLKLGATVRPLSEENLSLVANYTSNRIDGLIATFPTATPEIEAAFPERFIRDSDGRLLQIDSRPVNFLRSARDEVRWGVNFSKRLGAEPPERGAGGEGGRGRQGAADGPGDRSGGQARPRGPRSGAGGGGRGFGGRGGGGGAGRLQLGLYHNWVLRDEIQIRDGLPPIDRLNGSAAGGGGGRPEHEVEFQANVARNGLGARLSGTWQSATVVRGGPLAGGGTRSDLYFSDLVKVNLRLFADLGAQPSLVRGNRWLQGTRISLAIDNLFDSRQDVRDSSGATPLGYQSAYQDPLGRSVRLSIRKLFF